MILATTSDKFNINFSKAETKLCLSFHYNGDNSYLFVNGKVICRFKANNKTTTFASQFCYGSKKYIKCLDFIKNCSLN